MAQQTVQNLDTGLVARNKINQNFTELYGVSNTGGLSDNQGPRNPVTNTPTITSSIGVNGYFWEVSADGTRDIDGTIFRKQGDYIRFDGSSGIYRRIGNSSGRSFSMGANVLYVNPQKGNNTTAQIGEGEYPYQNMQGALDVIPAMLNGGTSNIVIRCASSLYLAGNQIKTVMSGGTGGVNSTIISITKITSGNLIVSGSFSMSGSISNSGIVKLDQNGEIDSSFVIGTGFFRVAGFASVRHVVQTDGKIICFGSFDSFNGNSCVNICRLNANGSFDATYVVGTGTTGSVVSGVLQTDGKLVIVGNFVSYNGSPCPRICRINTDGTFDATFMTGTGLNSTPTQMTIQPDDKVIVVGLHTTYNGFASSRIVRINTDGSIDTSFVIGSGFSGTPQSIFYNTTENKIYVGGTTGTRTYQGVDRGRCIRINTDGSPDTSFSSLGVFTGALNRIVVASDGKVYCGGVLFSGGNGGLRRLNTNGSLDTTFNPFIPNFLGGSPNCTGIVIESDGRIVIVGSFMSIGSVGVQNIARLNTNGGYASDFKSGGKRLNLTIIIEAGGQLGGVGSFFTFPDGGALFVKLMCEYIPTQNISDGLLIESTSASDQYDNLKTVLSSVTRLFQINSNSVYNTTLGTGSFVSINNIILQSNSTVLFDAGNFLGRGCEMYNLQQEANSSVHATFIGAKTLIIKNIQTRGGSTDGGDNIGLIRVNIPVFQGFTAKGYNERIGVDVRITGNANTLVANSNKMKLYGFFSGFFDYVGTDPLNLLWMGQIIGLQSSGDFSIITSGTGPINLMVYSNNSVDGNYCSDTFPALMLLSATTNVNYSGNTSSRISSTTGVCATDGSRITTLFNTPIQKFVSSFHSRRLQESAIVGSIVRRINFSGYTTVSQCYRERGTILCMGTSFVVIASFDYEEIYVNNAGTPVLVSSTITETTRSKTTGLPIVSGISLASAIVGSRIRTTMTTGSASGGVNIKGKIDLL